MPNDENPYEDNSEMNSEQRALADMRRLGDEEAKAEREENTLEVGAPVREEGDAEEGPGLTGKAKKRDRAKQFREDKARQIEAANAERDEARSQLAEVRGMVETMSRQSRQPQQQQQAPDRFDAEASQQEDAQAATLAEYQRSVDSYARDQKQMPEAEQQQFLARNRQHNRDIAKTEVHRALAAQNTPQSRVEARLMAQHSDVMTNDSARRYAVASYQMKEAAGQIKSAADATRAEIDSMNEARKQFRLGAVGNPPPSERQQASYGRMGRSSGGSAPRTPKSYTITSAEKEMALSLYSKQDDLSDAQKYQKWVNSHAD